MLRTQVLAWSLNSLALTLAVTVSCLVLGIFTAWLLTWTDLRWTAGWTVLATLPLAVPSYVASLGWLMLSPGLRGFLPAWLILTAVTTPYVTLPAAAAMRRADPALVEVARTHGRSAWRALCAGLLPQAWPAAAAGALLAALYTISDFGAVAMLRFEVFTFAIHRQYGSFIGRDLAAVLSLLLVIAACGLIWAERRMRGQAQRWRTSSGASRAAPRARLGRWTIPAIALAMTPVLIGAGAPLYALFSRLLERGTRWPLVWSDLVGAGANTVSVAALGGVLALVLALPIGVVAARYGGRLVRGAETAGFAGHALPGIVVGLSLVYFSLRAVPVLYQTTLLLAFAYAVLFMPKAIGAARTSVAAVPPAMGEVSRSLGRSRAGAAAVTARLAAPGIAAGLLLVVVTAMKELPATLMLRPTGMETLATEIWARTTLGAYGAAAPYGLAIVAVAAVPALLLSRRDTWEVGR